MSENATLEQRVSAVEKAVLELQSTVRKRVGSKGWLKRLYGIFDDRPEFAEVVRLGREFRDAQPME